jgi:hypothetical protein
VTTIGMERGNLLLLHDSMKSCGFYQMTEKKHWKNMTMD